MGHLTSMVIIEKEDIIPVTPLGVLNTANETKNSRCLEKAAWSNRTYVLKREFP